MQNKKQFTQELISVREALTKGKSILQAKGISNPALEGELLLANLLNKTRTSLLINLNEKLSKNLSDQYEADLNQRARGYPLQYLTGKQEFMSLDFSVSPQVLIPRADTEILVEKMLTLKEYFSGEPQIIDVGTGSGAIAISLAYYWPEAIVHGVDISSEALKLAKLNAQNHGVKLQFSQGDLLTEFIKKEQKFDLIISNPPYIPTGELKTLPKDVQQEPSLALNGGVDGLDYYRRLIPQSKISLKKGGFLGLEIGWNQGEEVKKLMVDYNFKEIELLRDYGNRNRVLLGKN